jgi:putative ABC transport system permease protein
MHIRDFNIGWRLLLKEPAYSSVVIFGLAIGVAVCYLMLGLVRHSMNYDSSIPHSDSIHVVKQRWNNAGAPQTFFYASSLRAHETLMKSGLPLMAASAISREVDVRVGNVVQSIDLTVAHPDFRKIFSLRQLAGDMAEALGRPDTVALTDSAALKLFGHTRVVGQVLQIDGMPYRVAATLPAPAAASTVQYEMLTGISTSIWKKQYRDMVEKSWGSSHGPLYIRLGTDTTPQQVVDALYRGLQDSDLMRELSPSELASTGGRPIGDFRLGILRDRYLDQDVQWHSVTHNPRALAALAAIAVLILLLAATNYVNLATVRAMRRQREIAVRKVLGASAGRVVQQFMAESILVCVLAAGLGLVLAWLFLPAYSAMLDRQFDHMFSPVLLACALLAALLLGVLSGAHPAWSALGVRPTAALAGRGNAETSSGLWLRRILTVLQFATAIGLSAVTVAIAWQTRYAAQLAPGFDPAPLTVVRAPGELTDARVRAFRDALVRIPGVTSVGVAIEPITHNGYTTGIQREGGSSSSVHWKSVSASWFETHGLQPVAGRFYQVGVDPEEDDNILVINEAAAQAAGFANAQDAVGKSVFEQGKARRVLGVAPNLRHRSAKEAMQPTIYRIGLRAGTFTVRSDGDKAAVQTQIEALWARFFPNDLINMKNASAYFAESYEEDMRLATLLGAASLVAMAIAAFGIYVLAAYSVQRRSREIVLRKLHGARGVDVAVLVGKEFAGLVGIAGVIGVPLAWVAMERFLAQHVERAPGVTSALVLALALALTVALASTLRHTVAAMRLAPLLALRD